MVRSSILANVNVTHTNIYSENHLSALCQLRKINEAERLLVAPVPSLLLIYKVFFLGAAFGTTPVVWQIFKRRARRDVALKVALFGVVDIFATRALRSEHFLLRHRSCLAQ
jgi:hypothetical protein